MSRRNLLIGGIVLVLIVSGVWLFKHRPSKQGENVYKIENGQAQQLVFTADDSLLYMNQDNDLIALNTSTKQSKTIVHLENARQPEFSTKGTYLKTLEDTQTLIYKTTDGSLVKKIATPLLSWLDDSSYVYLQNSSTEAVEGAALGKLNVGSVTSDAQKQLGNTSASELVGLSHENFIIQQAADDAGIDSVLLIANLSGETKELLKPAIAQLNTSSRPLLLQEKGVDHLKLITAGGAILEANFESSANTTTAINDNVLIGVLHNDTDGYYYLGRYQIDNKKTRSIYRLPNQVGNAQALYAKGQTVVLQADNGLWLLKIKNPL